MNGADDGLPLTPLISLRALFSFTFIWIMAFCIRWMDRPASRMCLVRTITVELGYTDSARNSCFNETSFRHHGPAGGAPNF